MIDQGLIREAARRLHDAAPNSRVILYGSHARGDARQQSDLDFLVIEPDERTVRWEAVRLRRVLGDLLVPMDIVVVSEHHVDEWRDVRGSLVHAALADGQVFAS